MRTTLQATLARTIFAAAATLFAVEAVTAQAASDRAMKETMSIGDEPGRISTEEVVITDGPFARQVVFFRSNEEPGTVVIHTS